MWARVDLSNGVNNVSKDEVAPPHLHMPEVVRNRSVGPGRKRNYDDVYTNVGEYPTLRLRFSPPAATNNAD